MGKNRDRRDIERALKSKGFQKKDGANHRVYIFKHQGLNRSVSTIVSRGSSYKVYDATLLSQMSTQLNLTNSQLIDLIDCPMDRKEYVNHLEDIGIIS